MRSAIDSAIVGAVALASISAANAADLSIFKGPPPMLESFSGWYLRGDIGMSNQRVKSLYNVLYDAPGITVQNVGLGFDSAPIFGVGFGYQYNNWLRFDLTGEYRGRANFHGTDIVSLNGVPGSTDEYSASKSEWLTLVNAYIDLGTWWHITPFIGAGVGVAGITINSFRDVDTVNNSIAFGADRTKWNFAWAVHAGFAYHVTPAFTIELAYRYVDLGDALSGDLITFNGINNVNNPMHFRDITSHDVKFGVRWMLPGGAHLPPPPLVRKG